MSNETKHFVLEDLDRTGMTWQRLLVHFEERIRRLRATNDSPLGAEETASIRGEIKVYKHLMRLNNKPRDVAED